MKELLSPYDRGTWKTFELVPLSGGGICKIRVGAGVGENKDMKHVKYGGNMTKYEAKMKKQKGKMKKYKEI